jgi:3-hydroxyisobutyrate dehydrogenase-like beta-hydroxyacid dehydrogenase
MLATRELRDSAIGIIGLGIMGSSFAQNLLSKGFQVHVFNRTREKAQPLIDKGATFHPTAQELAYVSDIVMTSLTDEKAVEALALGDDGFIQSMNEGGLWIDLSTIDPVASVRHASAAKAAGKLRLDAPVVGSRDSALSGNLIVLVGGEADVFQGAEDFLNQIGRTVIYLGEDGNGHKMKLAVNLFLGLVAESFSESLTLARKFGLDPKVFVDTINRTPHKNYFTEGKGPKIVAEEFEPAFSLDNLYKDLRLVNLEVNRSGAVLPLTEVALGEYSAAIRQGQGKKDFSIIAHEVQRKNGLY